MSRGRRTACPVVWLVAWLVATMLLGLSARPGGAQSRPQPKPARKAPTAYLIYLLDGREPLVVKSYQESGDEIRFEKYGGRVGIPKYEVLKIVPDDPDATPQFPSVPRPPLASAPAPIASLPAASSPAPVPPAATLPPVASLPPASPAPGAPRAPATPPAPTASPAPATPPGPAEAPQAIEPAPPAAEVETSPDPAPGDGQVYVTLRNGGQMKADGITAEGDRIRVDVPDGSFTVPRADLVGIVRIAARTGLAEAWLTLAPGGVRAPEGPQGGDTAGDGPQPPGTRSTPTDGDARSPLPYPASDQPHLLRLANGQVLKIDGFWIEGGEVRFRRLGGLVGVALAEVLRLIPEGIAPVHARTEVFYVQQLGPDLLEVRVKKDLQRVRLIGVEPIPGAQSSDNPWARLRPGFVLELEFDRQRTGLGGEWLAYAFLPNRRMLNGELIRLGLARPRSDGKNLRYLDLFEELAGVEPASFTVPR